MNEINPFASPRISANVIEALPVGEMEMPASLWRDGRLLVMRKHVTLPDICVKSNETCQGPRLKRTMYWHHPAVFATVLAGLLVYVVLALLLRKSATVWIPLSEAWWARRRRALMVSWIVSGVGLLSLVLGIALNRATDGVAGWGILVGIVLLFGGAIYGAIAPRMVAPHKIDDELVWPKGVHPDYLAKLPSFRL